MTRFSFAALAVAVVAVLAAGRALGHSSYCEWRTHTAITAPSILEPSQSNNGVGVGEEVTFTCSECEDHDERVCYPGEIRTYPEDTVHYLWSDDSGRASGQSFPEGNTGRSVIWRAPSSPDTYNVTVTVYDEDNHPPGVGDDSDEDRHASRGMEVVRLDQVRVYYSCSVDYPYASTTQFKTRAVVWATQESQKAYCDIGFDESLTWYKTGDEGPRDDPEDLPPPTSGTFSGTTVEDDWPDNWPDLTIEWKLLKHQGSSPSGGHRKYSYAESGYLSNSWGENNRSYNTPGLHRLRATAKMNPGETWEQSVTSRDKEYALRICPMRDITTAGSSMREDYVEWISTYEEEPYEWGGEGYGGKDSNDQYVGGGPNYDGYGIDCSGLVSCGAERAGYNWDYPPPGGITWRVSTWALAGDYCSDPVPYGDFDEGDIIVKGGVHVVSCGDRKAEPYENDIFIIHASSSANKVIHEQSTITAWTDPPEEYALRRLEAH